MPIEQALVVDFAALILLLLVIRWLAGVPGTLGGTAALRALIAAGQSGPLPADLVIGRDGRVAIAFDAEGETAILIFLLGARPVVWRVASAQLRPPAAHYDRIADSLIIATGESTRPRLVLLLPKDDPHADRLRAVASDLAVAS